MALNAGTVGRYRDEFCPPEPAHLFSSHIEADVSCLASTLVSNINSFRQVPLLCTCHLSRLQPFSFKSNWFKFQHITKHSNTQHERSPTIFPYELTWENESCLEPLVLIFAFIFCIQSNYHVIHMGNVPVLFDCLPVLFVPISQDCQAKLNGTLFWGGSIYRITSSIKKKKETKCKDNSLSQDLNLSISGKSPLWSWGVW